MRVNICFAIRIVAAASIWGWFAYPTDAEDPITMWQRLSPQQQSEVQKTLTERLPAVLGDDFGDYANRLATEIPRWVSVSQQLESGDYTAVLGKFQDELSEFVVSHLDKQLPPKGFARWVFNQAKKQTDLLRQVAINIADPKQEWGDVRDSLFSEVSSQVQSRSEEVLTNAVVYVINEVVGNPGVSLEGYSPGELYVLAVIDFKNLMSRMPVLFERQAVNQMYQVYRVQREKFGQDTAWEVVRHQWETERVTDPEGKSRAIRSWSARMVHLQEKFKVPFDEIPDKLLTLFDAYWETPRGQDTWEETWDRGCHGWMEQQLRSEIEAAHSKLRQQARQEFERASELAQTRLKEAHRKAAIELHRAIEQQLTDQQRAERDAAIQQARTLVEIIRERNVLPAEKECEEFSGTAAALDPIYQHALAAHVVLYDGLADEVSDIRQQVEGMGTLVASFQKAVATVTAKVDSVEAAVTLTEQTAESTCQLAGEVVSADSKETAYDRMLSALRTAKSMEPIVIDAHDGVFAAKKLLQTLEKEIRGLERDRCWKLESVKVKLHQIDAALDTLSEVTQLRTLWEILYPRLRAAASRLQLIRDEFEANKSQIESLLASHHPNEQTAEIRNDLTNYEARLACLQSHLEDWEQRWREQGFPAVEAPDPQQLQQARDVLAAHPQLLQWASGAHQSLIMGLGPIGVRVDGFSQRVSGADLRASLCAAKAIVDYNKAWNQGNVPGLSETEADAEPQSDSDDLSGIAESITRVPVADDESSDDADLTAISGSITRVPAGQREPPQQPNDPDREPRGPETTGTGMKSTETPAGAGGRGPAQPGRDAVPTEDRQLEPFYAVFKVHPIAPMPKFSGSDALNQMQRWLMQLNADTIRISDNPAGEISFLVTGKLLKEFAEHQKRTESGKSKDEHPLFRKGHRYHQIGTLTINGMQLPYPMLLTYSHETTIRPTSQVPIQIQPLDRNWQSKLQLTDAQGSGRWSIRDNKGSALEMGPVTYSGAGNWSLDARRAAAEYLKRFGLGFLQQ